MSHKEQEKSEWGAIAGANLLPAAV
jgi:hypothetical protein